MDDFEILDDVLGLKAAGRVSTVASEALLAYRVDEEARQDRVPLALMTLLRKIHPFILVRDRVDLDKVARDEGEVRWSREFRRSNVRDGYWPSEIGRRTNVGEGVNVGVYGVLIDLIGAEHCSEPTVVRHARFVVRTG